MAILSFELNQLFMLLVPDLLAFLFPSEPDFVQKSLSVKSNFVIEMARSLRMNPPP
jgi:hypothetical protein